MTVSTDLDKVRVLIGDTDATNPLFPDDQINLFLELASNSILLAAAHACDAAAAKFARDISFQTDDQKFERRERAAEFRAMAQRFRAQASGVTGVVPTKQDGYSDDVPADQFSQGASRSGRANWYTNRDRVF